MEVVVYLLTHARLFATPLTAATSSSIHGILQARILSGFPFSSFILLLHSVTLSTFYFFFKAYLFCLCWVFVTVSGLSLVAAAVPGLLLAVASLVLEHRL